MIWAMPERKQSFSLDIFLKSAMFSVLLLSLRLRSKVLKEFFGQ